MMIKKQLGVLAAAVVAASSASAFFEEGDAMLYAHAPSNATYFVDLGVTGQDLVNGAEVNITDSGLAAWLNGDGAGATWSIVASVNGTATVAGPPAEASLVNNGVVAASSTGSFPHADGTAATGASAGLNAWMADLQGSSESFSVGALDPRKADSNRNGAFFNDAQISVGSAAALFYGQASPVDNDTLGSASLTTQVGTAGDLSQSAAMLTIDGVITANVSAVPVPAAAWLFGSALTGLLVARRNK